MNQDRVSYEKFDKVRVVSQLSRDTVEFKKAFTELIGTVRDWQTINTSKGRRLLSSVALRGTNEAWYMILENSSPECLNHSDIRGRIPLTFVFSSSTCASKVLHFCLILKAWYGNNWIIVFDYYMRSTDIQGCIPLHYLAATAPTLRNDVAYLLSKLISYASKKVTNSSRITTQLELSQHLLKDSVNYNKSLQDNCIFADRTTTPTTRNIKNEFFFSGDDRCWSSFTSVIACLKDIPKKTDLSTKISTPIVKKRNILNKGYIHGIEASDDEEMLMNTEIGISGNENKLKNDLSYKAINRRQRERNCNTCWTDINNDEGKKPIDLLPALSILDKIVSLNSEYPDSTFHAIKKLDCNGKLECYPILISEGTNSLTLGSRVKFESYKIQVDELFTNSDKESKISSEIAQNYSNLLKSTDINYIDQNNTNQNNTDINNSNEETSTASSSPSLNSEVEVTAIKNLLPDQLEKDILNLENKKRCKSRALKKNCIKSTRVSDNESKATQNISDLNFNNNDSIRALSLSVQVLCETVRGLKNSDKNKSSDISRANSSESNKELDTMVDKQKSPTLNISDSLLRDKAKEQLNGHDLNSQLSYHIALRSALADDLGICSISSLFISAAEFAPIPAALLPGSIRILLNINSFSSDITSTIQIMTGLIAMSQSSTNEIRQAVRYGAVNLIKQIYQDIRAEDLSVSDIFLIRSLLDIWKVNLNDYILDEWEFIEHKNINLNILNNEKFSANSSIVTNYQVNNEKNKKFNYEQRYLDLYHNNLVQKYENCSDSSIEASQFLIENRLIANKKYITKPSDLDSELRNISIVNKKSCKNYNSRDISLESKQATETGQRKSCLNDDKSDSHNKKIEDLKRGIKIGEFCNEIDNNSNISFSEYIKPDVIESHEISILSDSNVHAFNESFRSDTYDYNTKKSQKSKILFKSDIENIDILSSSKIEYLDTNLNSDINSKETTKDMNVENIEYSNTCRDIIKDINNEDIEKNEINIEDIEKCTNSKDRDSTVNNKDIFINNSSNDDNRKSVIENITGAVNKDFNCLSQGEYSSLKSKSEPHSNFEYNDILNDVENNYESVNISEKILSDDNIVEKNDNRFIIEHRVDHLRERKDINSNLNLNEKENLDILESEKITLSKKKDKFVLNDKDMDSAEPLKFSNINSDLEDYELFFSNIPDNIDTGNHCGIKIIKGNYEIAELDDEIKPRDDLKANDSNKAIEVKPITSKSTVYKRNKDSTRMMKSKDNCNKRRQVSISLNKKHGINDHSKKKKSSNKLVSSIVNTNKPEVNRVEKSTKKRNVSKVSALEVRKDILNKEKNLISVEKEDLLKKFITVIDRKQRKKDLENIYSTPIQKLVYSNNTSKKSNGFSQVRSNSNNRKVLEHVKVSKIINGQKNLKRIKVNENKKVSEVREISPYKGKKNSKIKITDINLISSESINKNKLTNIPCKENSKNIYDDHTLKSDISHTTKIRSQSDISKLSTLYQNAFGSNHYMENETNLKSVSSIDSKSEYPVRGICQEQWIYSPEFKQSYANLAQLLED